MVTIHRVGSTPGFALPYIVMEYLDGEALTGEPPFRGQIHLILPQVVADEPVPPRKRNDAIPRDLETMTLKCLTKEPGRRYQAARELADDLQRWLDGEPIRARPVGTWERAWKWVKRRPAAAALLGVSGLALLGLLALGVGAVYHRQLDTAYRAEAEARAQAAAANAKAETYQYFYRVGLAAAAWRDGNMGQVGRLLEECPAERRNWDWHYLNRLCHPELLTLRGHRGHSSVCQKLYAKEIDLKPAPRVAGQTFG